MAIFGIYVRFLGDFSLWRCRWPFGLQREKAAPGAKWSQPQLGIQWRWHQKTRPCQTQLPGLISELQENQQGSLPLWLDGKNSVTDFGNRNFRTLHLGPSKAMILCTERSSILKWSCLGLILLWCLTNTESCWSGSSRCCNSVLDAWCLKSCWACRHLLCTICIVYTEMIHPLKMQLRRNRSRKGLFQKKKRTTVTTGSLSTRGWTQGIAVDTFFSSEDPLLHWLLHPFSVLGETTRMPPQKLAKSGKLFHQQKIHLYWTHKDHSSWSIDGEIFGEPISGRKSWEFYKITPNNPSLKHPTGVDTVLHLQIVGRHRHLFRFFIQRVHQKKEPLLH